ncbi:nucleoside deaminase [Arcobacter sp. FWKO B]|uniref:nucleoside deaminase n=1 Tax=Arcobacter sp. FWKO B TaxID=2593672 RepID=UPI0018A55441|nr:nucleoside deaminase [Arcobacter sp. FWKO B]QOG11312.1 nucleoside deaminase [Arcobacter sp. FWKO B]
MGELTTKDLEFLNIAYKEAKQGYEEGGVPVGSVMSCDGELLSKGHNKRVQEGNPIAHGEMDCIQKAGRRANYHGVTLYTTLSPCMMCSGTIVQFGIKRVVIGENKNFDGNIEFLRQNGVEVHLVGDKACENLMDQFIKEKPELWNEDIAQD